MKYNGIQSIHSPASLSSPAVLSAPPLKPPTTVVASTSVGGATYVAVLFLPPPAALSASRTRRCCWSSAQIKGRSRVASKPFAARHGTSPEITSRKKSAGFTLAGHEKESASKYLSVGEMR